jgi:hypothetical protein
MARDKTFIATTAFPAAGANNNSAYFDLNARVTPDGKFPSPVEVQISWPALVALVDAKSVTFTINECATAGGNYTATGLSHIITGAGGVGVAAGSKVFRLPPNVMRYIKLNQAEAAGGGDITASSSTFELLFP